MSVDIGELERLAKAATPGPWRYGPYPSWDFMFRITGRRKEFLFDTHIAQNGEANAAYIVAACNSLPTLIAENRALQEKVRKLERQTVILASHLSKYVMHTMSTKEWLEWSERTAKEAGEDAAILG